MVLQVLVYLITVVMLIRQFRIQTQQVNLQIKTIQKNQYAKCQSDYSALLRMAVENGFLQSVYDDIFISTPKKESHKWHGYNERERAIFNYFELNYELFERLFYLWKERAIDDETWKHWENWLDRLIVHPIFRDMVHETRDLFGDEFEQVVRNKIDKLKK
jgi:hypothetical protein